MMADRQHRGYLLTFQLNFSTFYHQYSNISFTNHRHKSMKSLFRKKSVAHILEAAAAGELDGHGSLKKNLTLRDLTAFGIAAIIGAGIFSTIGNASSNGGPGVIFLFIFTAVACTFSAFAYAEFASMIPVAGSAYTYSYVAFGELIAWIIGWDLLMEYAIGNIAVAISWSDYFTSLVSSLGYTIPEYLTMDFLSAWRGHDAVVALMQGGATLDSMNSLQIAAYHAWLNAPQVFGVHLVADVPALVITFFITWLVYIGIKESKNASNMMVLVKLAIILMVIAVGAFYIRPENWSPFMPNGIAGVMKGVSAVFFAYIGFDAISTTAEECENPQRDLPRGMFLSIIICTVLYVAIALVLTGMVKYSELNVGDPLAYAFSQAGLNFISGVIAISAVVAMASVLLVFQLGQPRIWMSMSRDGLLPKVFSKIHPKYRTPSFSTIVTGFVVAVPALFMNLTEVTDLTSIGTLFAFVLVCGGVLQLQMSQKTLERKFKTPYVNSKYIAPALFVIGMAVAFMVNGDRMNDFFSLRQLKSPEEFLASVSGADAVSAKEYFAANDEDAAAQYIRTAQVSDMQKFNTGWETWKHTIPTWLFLVIAVVTAVVCYRKDLSLIPVLGLISCFYLMSELGYTNWIRFLVWLGIGLAIYFMYGKKHSKLASQV
jgi:APA family basic amino acid/polyamine antiporter